MAGRGRLTGRRLAIPLLGALAAAALIADLARSQSPARRSAFRVAQLPAATPHLESEGVSANSQRVPGLGPTETQFVPTPASRSETSEVLDTPKDEEIVDYTVPLRRPSEGMVLESEDGLISLVARNASLQDILTALAETQGLNLITQESVSAQVNATLNRVPFDDVLDIILSTTGFTWVRNRNVIQVTSIADAQNLAPETQGRQVEVFHLDYVSATDVSSIVQTMLSPAGNATVIESAEDDNRRTQEILVVQDLPGYIENIRHYISRHDIPPRQVLIEAYILKVELGDDMKHGVNLEHFFGMEGNLFEIESRGLANTNASQGFMVTLGGGNLGAVVEMLETTTDAKTLASPKIRVINGQTARIQVGEQLGFRVTTTTETSTTESVEFLDVGVVLEVTPRIGSDGTVVMRVSPEVSSGLVNPNTGLPEEETTELQTDVMFHDNQAYVIGGLIQETDTDSQAKLPWLGDLKHVGHLFQRTEVIRRRSEVIVVLRPKVMPFDPVTNANLLVETERATTPLLYGPLLEHPRPWEAQLPHVTKNPNYLRLPPTMTFSTGTKDEGFEPTPAQAGEGVTPLLEPTMDRNVGNQRPGELGPPPVYTSRFGAPTGSTPNLRMTRLPSINVIREGGSGISDPSAGTMLR